MSRKWVESTAVALLAAATMPAFSQSSAEVAELKALLAELQERLAQLEAKQNEQQAAVADSAKVASEAQSTADRTADVLAQTRAAISFAGDLRYRNESFDVELVDGNRIRDRLRARLNATVRINDTVRAVIGLATGGADPRSANATFTDSNSRKDFELDLGFAEWTPNAHWRVTAGKMRYAWVRTPSVLFDNDVNPEGLAVNYTQGNFFATGVYHWLTERALSQSNVTTAAAADSILLGTQVGWRGDLGDGRRLTVGASYFDFGGVQGYNPLFGGNSFGNTTTTSTAVCRRGITTCLVSDYNIVQVFADYTTTLADRPLRAYVDVMHNAGAEVNASAGEKLDTAYAVGFVYGAASGPKLWEVGALYQKVEKDAVFAQFTDSNFGDGNSDSEGFMLRGIFSPARNWTVNATLFLNKLANDVPTNVTVFAPTVANPNATATRTLFDRDYKRLQLDLNFRF
jgi:type II secretory pathway pseudopilin PulG